MLGRGLARVATCSLADRRRRDLPHQPDGFCVKRQLARPVQFTSERAVGSAVYARVETELGRACRSAQLGRALCAANRGPLPCRSARRLQARPRPGASRAPRRPTRRRTPKLTPPAPSPRPQFAVSPPGSPETHAARRLSQHSTARALAAPWCPRRCPGCRAGCVHCRQR
jgi:hypothetical protein